MKMYKTIRRLITIIIKGNQNKMTLCLHFVLYNKRKKGEN